MISVVILTKNEEKNIAACIASVSWCDEIVVIDDNSQDKTVEIARTKGARVYIHEMNHDFSAQRNFGLGRASEEWVLFIDADERVSSPLWYEIMQHINESNSTLKGFFIRRQDSMWGNVLKHGETGNIVLLRLARKGAGRWVGKVHETWKISGNTMTLQNNLDHYPHATVEEFLKEINFYTDLRAEELYEKKTKVYLWSIILYPLGKFFINYIIKRGFLDGISGLVFAILMSFHSFLVRSKLWVMYAQKKEL